MRQWQEFDGEAVLTYDERVLTKKVMKTFFIIYWTIFCIGWLLVRSYKKYHRHHIQRRRYAERHRAQIARLNGHRQLRLFNS